MVASCPVCGAALRGDRPCAPVNDRATAQQNVTMQLSDCSGEFAGPMEPPARTSGSTNWLSSPALQSGLVLLPVDSLTRFYFVDQFMGRKQGCLEVLLRQPFMISRERNDPLRCAEQLLDWQTQCAIHIHVLIIHSSSIWAYSATPKPRAHSANIKLMKRSRHMFKELGILQF